MQPKQTKISAVIFDMDGLMFDTESIFSIVQSRIAERYGKKFTLEVQNKMMGQKPLDAIKTMLAELKIDADPVLIANERDAGYVALLKTESKMMPGLLDFLDLLEQHGIRKAIASGSNHEWINILLERFALLDRFEVIVSGQDVKIGKPNPEIYTKAISKLNEQAPINPSSCIVLEDAVNGIRAAKSAGCVAVAIPSIFTKHQDFSEADYVVSGLGDEKLREIVFMV